MTFAAAVASPPTVSMLVSPHRMTAASPPEHAKSCRAKPPLLPPRLVHSPHHAHATRPNRPRRRHVPSPARRSPRQIPHSARGTAPLITRFRALALFGRRPQQRVDRPSSRRLKSCTIAAMRSLLPDLTRTPNSRRTATSVRPTASRRPSRRAEQILERVGEPIRRRSPRGQVGKPLDDNETRHLAPHESVQKCLVVAE